MAGEILSILARPAAQCAIRWGKSSILLCLLRKSGRVRADGSPDFARQGPPCRLCLPTHVSHLGSVIYHLDLIRPENTGLSCGTQGALHPSATCT
jgi:hypothetical protein